MITAGEVLKNKREKLGKTLETASLNTKIQKRFLQYIEENKFSYFDSEVFLTGFIKIYAKYLNLDVNKILALYRRSNPKKKESSSKKDAPLKSKKKFKLNLNILNPKVIITILLSTFLLVIIGYVGLQIYKFQSPPKLTILEPKPDIEVTSEDITVKVESNPNINIEINGLPVDESQEGMYEKNIKLNEGRNIITVKARKDGNNTLESVETIKITYNKEPEIEEEVADTESKESKITLEVIDSPAWIRLDIDDENKISKVIEPSKVDYNINEKLYIITGRISSTRLYYNNELIEWGINKTTGVAELTCLIEDFSLVCE
jgi:cytoskeletal protein RodZ